MFVFILSLYFFILCINPSLAYFDYGEVGNGINNSISANENTCMTRSNLNNYSLESLCNFKVKITDITNKWDNGKYIVKVIADLPSSYILKNISNKCNLLIFNNCLSFNEIVSDQFVSAKWQYKSEYTFNYNPVANSLNIVLNELKSNFKQIVRLKVPEAIYPISDFQFPIKDKYTVTQEFGQTDFSKNHTGIDFGVKNVKVFSVANGVVEYAGEDITSPKCNNGGKIIRIKHDNGLYSAYFHLSKLKVDQNQRVKKGELIGISGNSGQYNCKTMGYHLHFEIREGIAQSEVINPREIFSSI